jgi:DNA-binding protein HU-beta
MLAGSNASPREVEAMPNALGRGDLAGRVAARLAAPHAAGRRALDAVLAALTEALREGHTVILTRFGTFAVRPIGARRVRAIRGPRAGQFVTVPAHRRAGFRPGTELARAVAPPPPAPTRRGRRVAPPAEPAAAASRPAARPPRRRR